MLCISKRTNKNIKKKKRKKKRKKKKKNKICPLYPENEDNIPKGCLCGMFLSFCILF